MAAHPDRTSSLLHLAPCPLHLPLTYLLLVPATALLVIFHLAVPIFSLVDSLTSATFSTLGCPEAQIMFVFRIAGNILYGVIFALLGLAFAIFGVCGCLAPSSSSRIRVPCWIRFNTSGWIILGQVLLFSWLWDILLEVIQLVLMFMGVGMSCSVTGGFVPAMAIVNFYTTVGIPWMVHNLVKIIITPILALVLYCGFSCFSTRLNQGGLVFHDVGNAGAYLRKVKRRLPKIVLHGKRWQRQMVVQDGTSSQYKKVWLATKSAQYCRFSSCIDVSEEISNKVLEETPYVDMRLFGRIKFIDDEAYMDFEKWQVQMAEEWKAENGVDGVDLELELEIPELSSRVKIQPPAEDQSFCFRECLWKSCGQICSIVTGFVLCCRYALDFAPLGEKHYEFVKVLGVVQKSPDELQQKWEDMCINAAEFEERKLLLPPRAPELIVGHDEYDQCFLGWVCTMFSCGPLVACIVSVVIVSVLLFVTFVVLMTFGFGKYFPYGFLLVFAFYAMSPILIYVGYFFATKTRRSNPQVDASCSSGFFYCPFKRRPCAIAWFVVHIIALSLVSLFFGIMGFAFLIGTAVGTMRPIHFPLCWGISGCVAADIYIGAPGMLVVGILGFVLLAVSILLCLLLDVYQAHRMNDIEAAVFPCSGQSEPKFRGFFDCFCQACFGCDGNRRKADRFRRWEVTGLKVDVVPAGAVPVAAGGSIVSTESLPVLSAGQAAAMGAVPVGSASHRGSASSLPVLSAAQAASMGAVPVGSASHRGSASNLPVLSASQAAAMGAVPLGSHRGSASNPPVLSAAQAAAMGAIPVGGASSPLLASAGGGLRASFSGLPVLSAQQAAAMGAIPMNSAAAAGSSSLPVISREQAAAMGAIPMNSVNRSGSAAPSLPVISREQAAAMGAIPLDSGRSSFVAPALPPNLPDGSFQFSLPTGEVLYGIPSHEADSFRPSNRPFVEVTRMADEPSAPDEVDVMGDSGFTIGFLDVAGEESSVVERRKKSMRVLKSLQKMSLRPEDQPSAPDLDFGFLSVPEGVTDAVMYRRRITARLQRSVMNPMGAMQFQSATQLPQSSGQPSDFGEFDSSSVPDIGVVVDSRSPSLGHFDASTLPDIAIESLSSSEDDREEEGESDDEEEEEVEYIDEEEEAEEEEGESYYEEEVVELVEVAGEYLEDDDFEEVVEGSASPFADFDFDPSLVADIATESSSDSGDEGY